MASRVTLEDFRQLQSQLLDTRQSLHDTAERERNALRLIDRLRSEAASSSFPPPPPRRQQPATPGSGARYPSALNPFGAAESFSSSTQTDESSQLEVQRLREQLHQLRSQVGGTAAAPPPHEAPGDDRHAMTARRVVRLVRRVADAAALRLCFHGWRAAHAQTMILRNMSAVASRLGAASPLASAVPLPAEAAPPDADAGAQPSLLNAAESVCSESLGLELRRCEAREAALARRLRDAEADGQLAAEGLATAEAHAAEGRRALEAELQACKAALREADAARHSERCDARRTVRELAAALASAHDRALRALELDPPAE